MTATIKGGTSEVSQRALDGLPPVVRERLTQAVLALQDCRRRLDMTIANLDVRLHGNGRYEADALTNSRGEVEASMATVNLFREVAPANGVDAEKVLRELGGVPDFTPSVKAAEWM